MKLLCRSFIGFLCFSLVIIISIKPDETIASQESAGQFKDLTPQHWAYGTIAWALENNLAFGFEDQTFRPDDKVTQTQFMLFLGRAYGGVPTSLNYPVWPANQPFTRQAAAEIISATQGFNYSERFAIQYVLIAGLVHGKTAPTIQGFKGNDPLTCAESLQLIRNLLEKTAFKALLPRPLQPSDPTLLQVPKLFIETLKTTGSANQAIIVTAPAYGKSIVKIEAFERVQGLWYPKFTAKQGIIGKYGFTSAMAEGTKKSPEGIFTLSHVFGKFTDPGTAMPYKKVTKNDYWVDDPASKLYNSWQTGPVNGRWKSAEHLLREDDSYDYAVVIDYNTKRIAGKGSAIFLHVWQPQTTATLGCTALPEADLLEIIQWLDPTKHPVIIQGTVDFLKKL